MLGQSAEDVGREARAGSSFNIVGYDVAGVDLRTEAFLLGFPVQSAGYRQRH